MTKYKIGIIGYGDFTRVMIEMLSPYADIVVSSRSAREDEPGMRFGTLEEVLNQPIIIPSFPSQFFEDFFSKNSQLINPQAVVIDVCSVKTKPLQVLERYLPATCQIVGTHPMFGPASIIKNRGVAGLRCAFMPVRADQSVVDRIKDFLSQQLQLNIIDTTPEQHDRDMAYVQGLSHYIGRVMDIMKIPDTPLATMAYEDLLDMKRIQGGDSWDLFYSIVHENPYTPEIHAKFIEACADLDQRLDLKSQA